MRDLLELKDIALRYELWTFFRLADEITAVLESPPVRSGGLASGPSGFDFTAGGTFKWASGVRLVYNAHFSRSPKGHRHSYSVPLRPDIALSIPDGPNSGLHLFDAKFRVQGLCPGGEFRFWWREWGKRATTAVPAELDGADLQLSGTGTGGKAWGIGPGRDRLS